MNRWTNCIIEQWCGGFPAVMVCDGHIASCTLLRPGETHEQACRDYASTYDQGDYGRPIRCYSRLYQMPTDEPLDVHFIFGHGDSFSWDV